MNANETMPSATSLALRRPDACRDTVQPKNSASSSGRRKSLHAPAVCSSAAARNVVAGPISARVSSDPPGIGTSYVFYFGGTTNGGRKNVSIRPQYMTPIQRNSETAPASHAPQCADSPA